MICDIVLVEVIPVLLSVVTGVEIDGRGGAVGVSMHRKMFSCPGFRK